jgi:hypothetical protein
LAATVDVTFVSIQSAIGATDEADVAVVPLAIALGPLDDSDAALQLGR